jgi:hypothetical protein
MAIEKDVLDQLLVGRNPKDVFSKDGLIDELKKALAERILDTELDEHLAAENAGGQSNHRNGYSKKSVLTATSKMTVAIPRDPERFEQEATSQTMTPRQNCCIYLSTAQRLSGSDHRANGLRQRRNSPSCSTSVS